MSMRKLTKLAGVGLAGLLIATLLIMSASFLFALAPASPVGAQNGLVATRHLPATVQPGETFDVTVTFTAPGDLALVAVGDEAPADTWTVTVDPAKIIPFTLLIDVIDNKPSIAWFGQPAGTQFTACYQVTVPLDAQPGFYEFPAGIVKYGIYENGDIVEYEVPITGDYQVEVPKPSTVWVNDDWEGLAPGAPANGYIFGYNAFATIQDGIDGVADSTVHVLPGEYDGFLVEDRQNLSIIGQDGAVVTGLGPIHPHFDAYFMALVIDSTNIAISGLVFDDSEIVEPEAEMGIAYVGSTGSINGVIVETEAVYIGVPRFGIFVAGVGPRTVDIADTDITGWPIGVAVMADQVNLTNCTITGMYPYPPHGSIGIAAVSGAVVNVERCEISGFRMEPNGLPGFESLDFGTTQENGMPPQGIGIVVEAHDAGETSTALAGELGMLNGGGSWVAVTGCSKIFNNDIGIVVHPGGYLDINHSNIEDNDFGIYNAGGEANAERNWWGDAKGPSHEDNPFFDETTGDAVSDGVSYVPWLDASCPQGKPVGPTANFVAAPLEGLPPLEVQFTDLSEGSTGSDIVSWYWQFGDGTTSTEQHPIHTYTAVGTYTVRLTVTDELHLSNTATRVAYIEVLREARPRIPPDPANLVASYFWIEPQQVVPNQEVRISISIVNHGGTEGARDVVLHINGHFEDSQTVTVPAGSTQLVVFKVTKATPGTYYVSLEGNEGQFSVVGAPPTQWGGPLGTGGIITIVVVAIALVLALVFIFRRR